MRNFHTGSAGTALKKSACAGMNGWLPLAAACMLGLWGGCADPPKDVADTGAGDAGAVADDAEGAETADGLLANDAALGADAGLGEDSNSTIPLDVDVQGGPDTQPGADAVVAGDASPDVPSGPVPTLQGLSIQGIQLSAPFAPDIHDYAVHCPTGGATWKLEAWSSPGDQVSLVLPQPQPFVNSSSAVVKVAEGEVAVVRTTAPTGAYADYWLRCLPHDFPKFHFVSPGTPAPGYYMLGTTGMLGGSANYVMILDASGTPVWYHRSGAGLSVAEVLGPHQICFSSSLGGNYKGSNRVFTLLNPASGAFSVLQAVSAGTDQHELLPTESGKHLILGEVVVDGVDMSARGISATSIVDCLVQELGPDGSLLWQWRASEHIDVVAESTELPEVAMTDVPTIDPFHCNSIERDANGDVLISMRHTDALLLVSRATGKVIWKLGGTAANKEKAPHLLVTGDPDGGFFHQHDARFLPNGHVALFDNHTGQSGNGRALELALDIPAGSATIVSQFQGPGTGSAMGSLQTMPDGSRVIGWGIMMGGTPKLVMTEVDAAGVELRRLMFLTNDVVYRIRKVPLSMLDVGQLRANVGQATP